MTSTPPQPTTHRPLRVLVDIVLRAGGLVACAELPTALSDGADGVGLGLTVFLVLSSLAFTAAMLDGMLQRDRPRLHLVWGVVIPLVALVETASYVRMTLTVPGGYPSLQQALVEDDLGGTLLLYGVLVGPPAVVGILLGMLVRPLPPTPSRPATPMAVTRP